MSQYMKHSVRPVQDDKNNFFYALYEHASDLVLNFFYFEEDAIERKTFLDSGGAFDGFTPAFMLIEVPQKNPNKQFSEII